MQKNKATLSPEEKSRSKRVYIVFASLMLLGVLLALFTPENILAHPWAKAWTEFILGNTFPKLLDVPRLSTVPQVVAFYHATMLAFLPMYVFALCYSIVKQFFTRRTTSFSQAFLEQMKSRTKMLIIFLCMGFLFTGIIFFLLREGYGVDENSFSIGKYTGMMFGSRLSLSIGSLMFLWPCVLLVIGGLFSFPILFFYLSPYLPWFQKNNQKQNKNISRI